MFGWLTGQSASKSATPQAHARAGDREIVDIDPADVAAALAGNEPPLVLDVRTPEEYAQGHIPGALLMPLAQLLSRVGEIPKGKPVVCVCRSGNRSGIAMRQMRALGYAAKNMSGGMLRWRGPVQKEGRR